MGFWLFVRSENQMLSACVMVRPAGERCTSPTLKSSRNGPSVTRRMLVRDRCSPGRTRTSNLLITRSPRFPSDVDYLIALARFRATGTGRLVSEPSRRALELGCGLPWRFRALGFPQFTQFSLLGFPKRLPPFLDSQP